MAIIHTFHTCQTYAN